MVHQLVHQIALLEQMNQTDKKKLEEIIKKQKDVQEELQKGLKNFIVHQK